MELKEGHGGWNLCPTSKKQGTQKGFPAQEPHIGGSVSAWTAAEAQGGGGEDLWKDLKHIREVYLRDVVTDLIRG